jgi:hypothetical protein
MLKKQGLGLAVLLALTLRITDLFAEEEFVITTYYPSPYGSYNELEVYRSVTYKPINKASWFMMPLKMRSIFIMVRSG